MNVAVISMQSSSVQSGKLIDQSIEICGRRPGSDSAAMHAAINVQEHVDLQCRMTSGSRETTESLCVVSNRGEFGVWERLNESNKPSNIRPNRLVGQEHIARAASCGHFCFTDGGALEFGNAERDLHLNQLGKLMRFDMRPKALGGASNLQHAVDVFLDAARIDQKGRRSDFTCVR